MVVTAFNAAPGASLLTELIAIFEEQGSLEAVAEAIVNSDEFSDLYPSFLTLEEFAEQWLGRLVPEAPEAARAGAQELAVSLINGGATPAQIVIQAAAYLSAGVGPSEFSSSFANFTNKVAVATEHTVQLRLDGTLTDRELVLTGVTSDPASVDVAISDLTSPPADVIFDEIGELSIQENATEGVVGSVTATDPNTTEDYLEAVTYSLAEESHEDFSIDPESGEISYSGQGLDHETTPTIDLTVIATSRGANGTPTSVELTVTVMVGDVQENSPVFDDIGSFTLAEHADGSGMPGDDNAPINVGNVTATDADGDTITYSIKDAPEGWQILDDGKLCYIGTGIDFEEQQSVDLTIVASSLGANGTIENIEQNITVMIQDQNDAVWGESELGSLYELTSFADTAITLGNLVATDSDGDAITYGMASEFVEGEGGVLLPGFMVDAETGAITYTGPGIRNSTTESVNLDVTATSIGDNGEATTIEQTVTINIEAAQRAVFDEVGELSIQENVTEGVVGSVTATDPNSTEDNPEPVTYFLAQGSPEGFSIDRESGEISYSGQGLDHETTPSIDLIVLARSIGRFDSDGNGVQTFTQSNVTVMVEDVQENPPVFDDVGSFTLAEHADGSGMPGDDNAPINVGNITATDADGDTVTYSIKDAPEGWQILDDGKLCYIGTGIDFEEQQSVDLTIVASSLGANGTIENIEQNITVMIQDQNDAVWGESELVSLNGWTSGADSPIFLGNLVATDSDGDAITYGLASEFAEDDDGVLLPGFNVDAETGAITYTGPGIRNSTTESVNLDVTATSIGDNGQATTIERSVTIDITAPGDAENTFFLTTGIDRLVGTNQNDLFVALTTVDEGSDRAGDLAGDTNPEPTLTALDDIDGGGGYDILQLVYELGNTDPITWVESVRVSNVEEVQIETTGSFGRVGVGVQGPSFKGWDVERVKLGIVEGQVNFDADGAVVTNDDTLRDTVQIANAETVELTKVSDLANVTINSGDKTTLIDITGGNSIVINRDNGDNESDADDDNFSDTVEDVYIDGAADSGVTILSNAIGRLSLSNTVSDVVVKDRTNTDDNLEVTVNGYGDVTNFLDPSKLVLEGSGSAPGIDLIVEGNSAMVIETGTDNVSTKHLDISGGGKLQLRFAGSPNLLETVTVTENVALTMNAILNRNLVSFNASQTSGEQDLIFSGLQNKELTAVTTGSGGDKIKIRFSGLDKLATIDSGGGNDELEVIIGSALTSIITGSGDDELQVSGSPEDQQAIRIDMGSGNDTYDATKLNSFSRVTGGSGIDVLKTQTSEAVETLDADNNDSIYSDFEILDITGSDNQNYDLDNIGLHNIRVEGQRSGIVTSATLTNAQPRTSLSVIGGQSNAAVITYDLEGAENRDSDSVTIMVRASGGLTDALNNVTGTAILDLTVNDVETLVLDSSAIVLSEEVNASNYTNIVELDADALETLNLLGNSRISVTLSEDTLTSLETVNSAANSAGATVDANLSNNALTFTGGSGRDEFTGGMKEDTLIGGGGNDILDGRQGDDTIDGGSGNDIIFGDFGSDKITGGMGADQITTGIDVEGVIDEVRYTSSAQSRLVFVGDNNDTPDGFDVISDFNPLTDADGDGGDVIVLSRGIGITQEEIEGPTALFDKGGVSEAGLRNWIGTGIDFFADGEVDKDVAFAKGNFDNEDGGFLFFDVNGDGNFSASTDMVIFLVGREGFDPGSLQHFIDIV